MPPLFRDWHIFYQAAAAVREGTSPYAVGGFFNPIQVAWILSPTTVIPFSAWVGLMCAAAFLLVVVLNKKKAHWTLLSLPFIYGLFMGSLDMFLWVPARLFGGWGLSFLTLKPQLGAFIIPLQLGDWWRKKNFREIRRFALAITLLWGVPTIIQPAWIMDWIQAAVPSGSDRLHWAASIAGFSTITGGDIFYLFLFAAVILIMFVLGSNEFYLAASFAPYIWPSDWVITSEFATWRFTLLSWALVPTGIGLNGAQFYFLLGLLIWAERNPERIRAWICRAVGLFRIRSG